MDLKDPYDRSYEKSVNATITTLEHAAEKGAKHIAFQEGASKPEYLSLPDKLSGIASALRVADSQGKIDEVKALWTTGIRALDFNSRHIITLAAHHNDPGLLEAGYPYKQRPINKAKVSLLDLVPELTAKYLFANKDIVTGAYVVVIKRARNNAVVELQVTETPNEQDSWKRPYQGMYNESRIEFRGLEGMKKIYIRGRYHEKGDTGHWSEPVSIIIH